MFDVKKQTCNKTHSFKSLTWYAAESKYSMKLFLKYIMDELLYTLYQMLKWGQTFNTEIKVKFFILTNGRTYTFSSI